LKDRQNDYKRKPVELNEVFVGGSLQHGPLFPNKAFEADATKPGLTATNQKNEDSGKKKRSHRKEQRMWGNPSFLWEKGGSWKSNPRRKEDA